MSRFNAFEKRWLKSFAADIPKTLLQRYVYDDGNFIWHVFSWKLKPEGSFLTGDAARQAFDAADKHDAEYGGPWFCKDFRPPKSPTAVELDKRMECYAMSLSGKWTYIKTHESEFGPYFYRLA